MPAVFPAITTVLFAKPPVPARSPLVPVFKELTEPPLPAPGLVTFAPPIAPPTPEIRLKKLAVPVPNKAEPPPALAVPVAKVLEELPVPAPPVAQFAPSATTTFRAPPDENPVA